MATVRKNIDIVVMSMDYHDDEWTAKGHVVFKDTLKRLDWSARHKSALIVKLEEGWNAYPESLQQEVKDSIRSTLGYVNLPYNRTFTVTVIN